uniref:Uncharacterized protein n=1 Tax=Sym plasmid TaxID=28430 RepID=A0A515HJV6_9ZZZZ|nr:hypothetical protein pTT25_00028 [Sym plasmid]QDL89725.1 hypothetical protein pTT25_00041 [Sym plasmid]
MAPKNHPRTVSGALGVPTLTIATLRSLYQHRHSLYDFQRWAEEYLGLQDLEDPKVIQLQGSPPSRLTSSFNLTT